MDCRDPETKDGRGKYLVLDWIQDILMDGGSAKEDMDSSPPIYAPMTLLPFYLVVIMLSARL
jgi:hypothetical protein